MMKFSLSLDELQSFEPKDYIIFIIVIPSSTWMFKVE